MTLTFIYKPCHFFVWRSFLAQGEIAMYHDIVTKPESEECVDLLMALTLPLIRNYTLINMCAGSTSQVCLNKVNRIGLREKNISV